MNYEAIPMELKAMRRWVCWKRLEAADGKVRKVPVDPITGAAAKSNAPTTWADFSSACAACEHLDLAGIGIMLGDGIFGIDVDHCVNLETGELDDLAVDVLVSVPSYAEYSPSGTGIHILCAGTLPEGKRKKDRLEMYDRLRYFTVTGNAIGNGRFCDATAAAAELHARYMADAPQKPQQAAKAAAKGSAPLTNDALLERAFAGKNGDVIRQLYAGSWQGRYSSQSQADLALCNALAFWCRGDEHRIDELFRRSGLMRPKWDEKHGAATYGAMTVRKATEHLTGGYDAAPTMEQPDAPVGDVQPSEAGADGTYSYDDTGNAHRFADMHRGGVLYDYINKAWRIWDGMTWALDTSGEIKRRCDATLDAFAHKIPSLPENIRDAAKSHLKKSRSSKAKEAMLKEAQHLPGIPCEPGIFDRQKGQLNCRNGILNVLTGELLPHRQDAYMSLLAGTFYDPAAKAPLWEHFIEQIFCEDKSLVEYVQIAAGYSLLGDTREQCMFDLLGNGSNGKSTFLERLSDVMGDYCKNAQPDTLINKRSSGASSDIARLAGARLVIMQEPDKDAQLNEALVKQITGSSTVTARFLYKEEFEFSPQFKLWLASNYKPRVKGTDDGIWRRIRVIPFNAQFAGAQADRTLPQKLKKELSGILNWMVCGAQKWAEKAAKGGSGLPACAAVDDATAAYRAEMDTISAWSALCVCEAPDCVVQSFALYKAYQGWCRDNGIRFPLNSTRFGLELANKYPKRRSENGVLYIGIKLSAEGERFAESVRGATDPESAY